MMRRRRTSFCRGGRIITRGGKTTSVVVVITPSLYCKFLFVKMSLCFCVMARNSLCDYMIGCII